MKYLSRLIPIKTLGKDKDVDGSNKITILL